MDDACRQILKEKMPMKHIAISHLLIGALALTVYARQSPRQDPQSAQMRAG
jgi:hypothetical protein